MKTTGRRITNGKPIFDLETLMLYLKQKSTYNRTAYNTQSKIIRDIYQNCTVGDAKEEQVYHIGGILK